MPDKLRRFTGYVIYQRPYGEGYLEDAEEIDVDAVDRVEAEFMVLAEAMRDLEAGWHRIEIQEQIGWYL